MTINEFVSLPGFIKIEQSLNASWGDTWFAAAMYNDKVIYGGGRSAQQAIDDWIRRSKELDKTYDDR